MVQLVGVFSWSGGPGGLCGPGGPGGPDGPVGRGRQYGLGGQGCPRAINYPPPPLTSNAYLEATHLKKGLPFIAL